MQDVKTVKTDTVNELRNEIYFNQIEVQKILNNPGNLSHKKVVKKFARLLKRNITAANALDLLERYLPTPRQADPVIVPEAVEQQPSEVEGVKQVS